MRQMRKERNILDFEVISGKHYWGGVCDRDRDGGFVDVCVQRGRKGGGGVWMWV